MVTFLFLELVAGVLSAALFRPDMARSRSLGATVQPSFYSPRGARMQVLVL